jgi:hypothetical protein
VTYCENGTAIFAGFLLHASKTNARSGVAENDAAICKLSKFLLARGHSQYAVSLIGQLPVSAPGPHGRVDAGEHVGSENSDFASPAMMHAWDKISLWPTQSGLSSCSVLS